MHRIAALIRQQSVFVAALLLGLPVVGAGLFAPEWLDHRSGQMHGLIIDHFGWGYLIAGLIFLVFPIILAFSRYGNLKLGKDHEKPQYSYFGWFSMLFAAGMGIGLIFWSVAEPLSHFVDPPQSLVGRSPEAAKFSMVHSFYHWGMHPWAIYITISLAIAYFSFRRGMPPLISSCFYPLLGNRIYGRAGHAIDVLAVFATVFGIAASLGMSALQISSGLAEVSPLDGSQGLTLGIIGAITVLFLLASITGLDTGIQVVSKINILMALVLMAFIFIVGPTSYILNVFTTSLGGYFSSLLTMSLNANPFEGHDWTKNWTLFYWAWWISWSPFVGLFVASISRGRTVREFVLGALLVPSLLTFLWFSVFGGAALHLQLVEGRDIAASAVQDVPRALFEFLGYYPFTPSLTVLAILLLVVFFVTSAASATYVLAMMTSKGNLTPSVSKKIVWGIYQSAAAAGLIVSGGLVGLQQLAIAAALPFTLVMLLLCVSLFRAMKYEFTVERGKPPGAGMNLET